MGKWIDIVDLGPSESGKTKCFVVVSKEQAVTLGWIRWYGPFRKYAFEPSPKTVYEEDCLRDVAKFCEDATRKHREQRKAVTT